MSLTERDIKRNATMGAFRNGKELFLSDGVSDFTLDRDVNQGIIYLNGIVQGVEREQYEVSMELDEQRDWEVLSSRCQCEGYRNEDGHCKHIVALQLKYIEQENKQKQEKLQNQKKLNEYSQQLGKSEYSKETEFLEQHGKSEYSKETKFPEQTVENDYPVVTGFLEFLEDVEKIKGSRRKEANQEEFENSNFGKMETKKKETPEEQLRRLLGLGTVKKGITPKKPTTDEAIIQILERLARKTLEQTRKISCLEKPVNIEPQLSYNIILQKWVVSFKLYSSKKYVIKSLEEFVENVDNHTMYTYGKNLEFVHARENFAKSSLPLLDFILEYVHMRESDIRRSYYSAQGLKEIPLNDLLFEKLLLALEESAGKDSFSIPVDKTKFFSVVSGNPKGTYCIEKVEDGAILSFPEFETILGNSETYIRIEETIYHCEEEFSQDMRIFLEQLPKNRKKELFIAEKDLEVVCASMLPVLDRYFSLIEKNIIIEEYQPPEGKISIYLDENKEIGVICRVECEYGDKKYRIFEETDSSVYRDVPKETMIIQMICNYFVIARRKNSDFMLTEEEKLYDLLSEGISEWNQVAQVYATEAFRRNGIKQKPSVNIGVSIQSDLLDLSVDTNQLPYEELQEILNSYKLKKRYHRLKDGQFLELEESSLGILSELTDGLELTGEELKQGNIRLPKHRALYLDAVLRDAGEQVHIHRDQLFKGVIRNIKNVEDSDYEIPKQQYNILRNYQKKGYRWMRTLREYGFGGILADDMGLGKTLQVISLLQSIKEEWETKGAKEHTILALVVCPASLVYNWENEIAKFAPDLQTQVISGDAKNRKRLILKEGKGDVWITSYDSLKRDIKWYEKCHFDIHVIDEAQYIKNHGTLVAKSVKNVSSNTRFALTGTPIENRLSELWSIFDFLMPGLLFSYKKFREEMEMVIISGKNGEGEEKQEKIASERLRKMIRPFVLRRLKEEVLKDLPKKFENVVYAKMEEKQELLYRARVQQFKEQLENQSEEEFKNNKIEILSELTRLRQICCHPALCYEDYDGESAKMSVCMQMIEDAIKGGHKILLFSQFTSMLEKIEAKLREQNIDYYKLTGETKKEHRVQMANEFNKNEVPIFLISLRAGGTGLNLVGADIVIHFDPWWNLAAQNQATDRAHRIGQKNVVTVYKMITANSIEEKILALQEKKRDLANQIMSDEGMSETSLTREDLLEVLS